MEVKVKIACKKSDNKAFKSTEAENIWYNVNEPAIPYLAKLNKGDEIVVTYEKKGVSRYVSKLTLATVETPKEEVKTSTGFTCEICGAVLKDGKYKKCYTCNKSKAVKKEETKPEEKKPYEKKEWKSNYGSPEDIAGKETGCALGAAATVASGCGFSDPETAKQFTLALAETFLEWMRAKK